MIKEGKNIPVSAPQFADMADVLDKFRTFKNEPAMQMSHLIDFLSTPSDDRTSFYEIFTAQIEVINNRFALITYE